MQWLIVLNVPDDKEPEGTSKQCSGIKKPLQLQRKIIHYPKCKVTTTPMEYNWSLMMESNAMEYKMAMAMQTISSMNWNVICVHWCLRARYNGAIRLNGLLGDSGDIFRGSRESPQGKVHHTELWPCGERFRWVKFGDGHVGRYLHWAQNSFAILHCSCCLRNHGTSVLMDSVSVFLVILSSHLTLQLLSENPWSIRFWYWAQFLHWYWAQCLCW